MLAALRSDEYLALLDDTTRTIDELEPSGSAATLDELTGKAAAKLRKAVRKLPEEPSNEELHAVRKKGKRARYAAELAGRDKLVKRAKKLQDVLGQHQDAEVQEANLRLLADQLPPTSEASTYLALGQLVEQLDRRRRAARNAFAERFAEFDSRSTRHALDEMLDGIGS